MCAGAKRSDWRAGVAHVSARLRGRPGRRTHRARVASSWLTVGCALGYSVRKEAEERGGGGSGARARQGWAGGAHESFDSMPVAMELTEDDRAGRMKRRR